MHARKQSTQALPPSPDCCSSLQTAYQIEARSWVSLVGTKISELCFNKVHLARIYELCSHSRKDTYRRVCIFTEVRVSWLLQSLCSFIFGQGWSLDTWMDLTGLTNNSQGSPCVCPLPHSPASGFYQTLQSGLNANVCPRHLPHTLHPLTRPALRPQSMEFKRGPQWVAFLRRIRSSFLEEVHHWGRVCECKASHCSQFTLSVARFQFILWQRPASTAMAATCRHASPPGRALMLLDVKAQTIFYRLSWSQYFYYSIRKVTMTHG